MATIDRNIIVKVNSCEANLLSECSWENELTPYIEIKYNT